MVRKERGPLGGEGPSSVQFNSVQSPSRVQLFANPRTAAHQASLSITNSWSLLKLMSIESVMPSSHLILCHLLLPLPSVFPSIRGFSKACHVQMQESEEKSLCPAYPHVPPHAFLPQSLLACDTFLRKHSPNHC